jgi:hypothetical protein
MNRLNAETPSAPTPGVSKFHNIGSRLLGILAHVRQLVNELQAAYILHRANRATARRIARQGQKGGQR